MPGTIVVRGREFLYVEIRPGESFSTLMDDQDLHCAEMPLPADGGTIEEGVRIVVPDGTILFGVSYKGDLKGWRDRFTHACEETNRKWGVITGEELHMSDGVRIGLAACKIIFDP